MERFVRDPVCPIDEIAAYIDGELDVSCESDLQEHFAACSRCRDELNLQKQFLHSLETSLRQENDIVLPADFTKKVVANAESTVSGLRRPRERFNALFICAGLLLFILFALGTDARRVLDSAATVIDQVAAVGTFVGHLVYDFAVGINIVLRGFALQVRPDVFAAAFAAIVFVKVLVDDATVFVEQLDGNSTFGSRCRNGEAGLHVLDDAGAGGTGQAAKARGHAPSARTAHAVGQERHQLRDEIDQQDGAHHQRHRDDRAAHRERPDT